MCYSVDSDGMRRNILCFLFVVSFSLVALASAIFGAVAVCFGCRLTFLGLSTQERNRVGLARFPVPGAPEIRARKEGSSMDEKENLLPLERFENACFRKLHYLLAVEKFDAMRQLLEVMEKAGLI